MSEFGTYHLADNPTVYQPVRQNNFRFIVSGLDNLLRVGEDPESTTSYITNAQEVLDFSVVSFNPPHFSQGEIEVKRGNSTVYYASTPTFSDNQLVINDFVGADGKSVLLAWQSLSYNVIDDTIPSSDKYKVDATVLEYLPDNTLVRYWDLKGCWVKGISEVEWNNESSGKKTVTATIRFDRAIPHLPD
jgi:hypothetical protein